MAKSGRAQNKESIPDKASRDARASFDWEFGHNDHPATSPSSPDAGKAGAAERAHGAKPDAVAGGTQPAQNREVNMGARQPTGAAGQFTASRLNFVRQQLALAQERWWAAGELPPLGLLRDGLLLLAAGEPLTESQRTLLLRAALYHDRGVQSALQYQQDEERVALVLAEATVEWAVPIEAARLGQIVAGNEAIRNLLVSELERSRILLTGEARYRAEQALVELTHNIPVAPPDVRAAGRQPATPPVHPVVPPRRKLLRQLLLLLLLVTLIGFVMWQRGGGPPAGMVALPTGSYALLDADGRGATGVPIEAFWIDQYEVTNHAYRECLEAGACVWPTSPHSATRRDYFTNPAFDAHPVVNVTYAMADAYCRWQGKRLPTAAEWQAAASVSPTNGQAFRYPWGETFDAPRANSLHSGVGDTVAVGSYRPGGDSPSGAVDMAGNVAEWSAAREGVAIVKGGSFADEAEELTVGHSVVTSLEHAAPQLGFRCARSQS